MKWLFVYLMYMLGSERGFALVDGPLFSLEAKGKIGDAIVFFPWKGRHAVRRWLKPTNPRDVDQKIIRQKMGAIGKVLGIIVTPGDVLPNGSAAVVAWKAKTPAAQIWNAYLVKNAMVDLSNDATFTAFSAAIAGADEVDDWEECATTMGLAGVLSTADGYASDISPGLQLAMAAYAAYKVELSTATDVYSVSPENWTTAQISQFATDLTAAY